VISDRVKASLEKLIRAALPTVDYYALYRAKVVSQSSDKKKVDVKPDNPKIPDLTAELVTFGPKSTITIASGSYVLVGWDGGDPSKPIAMGFYAASGTKEIARKGDTADAGTLVFFGGTAGATLTYVPPGVTAPPAPPATNIPISAEIDSGSDTLKID